jgi:hypothetical protein
MDYFMGINRRTAMNKSTKTALRQMRKDELVEFTWNLVQHYNVMSKDNDYLRSFVNKTLIRQGFPDNEQTG